MQSLHFFSSVFSLFPYTRVQTESVSSASSDPITKNGDSARSEEL